MKVLNSIFAIISALFFAASAHAFTYQSTTINEYQYTPVIQPVVQDTPKNLRRGFFRGSIFEDTSSCTRCKNGGSIFNVGSCTRCSKDGSMFPGGVCKRCSKDGSMFPTGVCKRCKKIKQEQAKHEPMKVEPIKTAPVIIQYNEIEERRCENFAPFMLGHVDFRLKNAWNSNDNKEKIGNYNFRIFGCRRFDREAILNQGRIMQKDMQFTQAFAEEVSNCYTIIQIPEDLCLQQTPTPLPEYVLNAEITDYFMNVCDGYSWDQAKATNARNGSSEMTVRWKLTDLSGQKVLWEGTTTGYGEVAAGTENGEILLVERAFADASSNLQIARGFEDQLSVRLTEEELANQRNILIEQEKALNPAKCLVKEPATTECPVCNCPTCNCETPKVEEPAPMCAPVIVDDNYIELEPVLETITIIEEPAPVENSAVVEETAVSEEATIMVEVAKPQPEEIVVKVAKEEPVVTSSASEELSTDKLCIVDRAPYETLSAENLYKVRASILSIINSHGEKGAGLLVSDSFVLTSADLIDGKDSVYKLKTINGKNLSAKAFRVNTGKNVALLMLDKPTEYTPLSLNLELPEIGQSDFMVLGMLDVDNFENGENYIDNDGVIDGYRYTEERGAEIILDTFVQDITVGGALIDQFGTINGISHSSKKTEDGKDLFIPTETALRAVGLSICEKIYKTPSPWQKTVYKPITKIVEKPIAKAPEAMPVKDRK